MLVGGLSVRTRFVVALLCAGSVMGQSRGNLSSAVPRFTGSFGSVVFPGGTSAIPGVTRTLGSAVFPGGTAPHMVIPGANTDPTRGLRLSVTAAGRNTIDPAFGSRAPRAAAAVYAYPVYIPTLVDPSYYYSPEQLPQPAPQQPVNITIIYPPQQAPAQPQAVDEQAGARQSNFRTYPAPDSRSAAEPAAAAPQEAQYLLAFRDHNIYSAIAYWVDGDTLHYFTSGNKHNQASLSFVDRALTERLNRESGVTVDLPAAK